MDIRGFLLAAAVLLLAFPALAQDKVHRLVLQISDNSPEKMNTVLGNASNMARYYTAKGEKFEIRVVAYSGGVNMLRSDKSPVVERLKETSMSVPTLHFEVCNNTIENMAKAEGKKPADIPLVEGVKVVPAGIVELLELNEQGWTIVRP